MCSAAPGTVVLPKEMVKLQAAVTALQGAARGMEYRKPQSAELIALVGQLEQAVRTSCTGAFEPPSIPLFALPILDLATQGYQRCAEEMRKYQARNKFTKLVKQDMRRVIDDCIAATRVFSDMLQIRDGHSSLIENDLQPTLLAPAERSEGILEFSTTHISVPRTMWESFKFLLLGTANSTDGAIIAMGHIPLTVKAISQSILQLVQLWEAFRAAGSRINELHRKIEAWIDLLHTNYTPDSNDNVYDHVKGFIRVLLRSAVRLYFLRQTNRVKKFLAVGPVNEIIAGEIQAIDVQLQMLQSSIQLSTNAEVRGARVEIVSVKNRVDDVSNRLQTHIETIGAGVGTPFAAVLGDIHAVGEHLLSLGETYEKNAASAGSQLQGLDARVDGVVTRVEDILARTQHTTGTIDKLTRDVYHLKSVDDERRFVKWLDVTPRYEQRLRELSGQSTEHPGWFFGEKYQAWLKEGGVYWIYSTPGCGKSILIAAVVNHLAPKERIFFHFDMRRQEQQLTLRDFLAAIVKQLGDRMGKYAATLVDACNTKFESTASEVDLRDAAITMVRLEPLVIAIDALDECPEARDPLRIDRIVLLLEEFRDAGAKVIVTSRIEFAHLEQAMKTVATTRLRLNDEIHHRKAIRAFVHHQLASSSFSAWSETLRTEVEDTLVNRSDGMFLWVYLELVQLPRLHTDRVPAALQDLPVSLHATYEHILRSFSRDVHHSTISRASHILPCVAVSQEPLTADMVVDLCNFHFTPLSENSLSDTWSRDSVVFPYSRSSEDADPRISVLKFCPGLLHCEGAGPHSIQFIHATASEFLQSEACRDGDSVVRLYSFSPGLAHATWYRICCSILEHHRSHGRDGPSTKLVAYAQHHWAHHLCAAMESFPDSLVRHAPGPFAVRASLDEACKHGYWASAKWLITKGVSCDGLESWFSPLLYAINKENVEITKLLLECGAALLLSDSEKEVLLASAFARRNSVDFGAVFLTVRLRFRRPLRTSHFIPPLRRHPPHDRLGFDYIVTRHLHQSDDLVPLVDLGVRAMLRCAFEYGDNVELIRLLIGGGASLATTDSFGRMPLHWSVQTDKTQRLPTFVASSDMHHLHRRGTPSIALLEFCLEQGANIECRDRDGNTALLLAVAGRLPQHAAALIRHGASVHEANRLDETPIHIASVNGDVKMIQLLLQRDASVTLTLRKGRTPLQVAASLGYVEACRALIEAGSDVQSTTVDGATALHSAAEMGQLETVRLLLDSGAAPWTMTRRMCTPLLLAIEWGDLDVINELLRHHGDVSLTDAAGQTGLHRAAYKGNAAICSMLLSAGYNIASIDTNGDTALHIAVREAYHQVVRVLLDHRAPLSAARGTWETPLHLTGRENETTVVSPIIAIANRCGDTALHIASALGHEAISRLLLDEGSDPNAANAAGNTPLHLAVSQSGLFDLCRLLIDAGSNIGATNTVGDTALHLAKSPAVAQLLLSKGASSSVRNDSEREAIDGPSPSRIRYAVELAKLLKEQGRNIRPERFYAPVPEGKDRLPQL